MTTLLIRRPTRTTMYDKSFNYLTVMAHARPFEAEGLDPDA